MVIHEKFNQTASRFPQKTALQIKKGEYWEKLTYKDAEAAAKIVGAFLISEGFKKGDCAAIILENGPEWPIIYLGIMSAGLTCVPLDPHLSIEEIRNLLIDSSTRVVFYSQKIFADNLKQAVEGLGVKVIERLSDLPDLSKSQNILWPQLHTEDIASLIYTSGTTGKPKGVLLSHKNICSDFTSLQKTGFSLPADNFLSILPLYHSYSFMATLIMPLFLGATVTYAESFSSEELMRLIGESKVTILTGVPQIFSLLHRSVFSKINKIPSFLMPLVLFFVRLKVKKEMSSLRYCVSGGARLEPDIGRDLWK
ncbi:MAG: long-chain fatty acid--CoA ligase, partial [Candidatus Omnitrophica bacterium]|nr:long-chain fatty acid--CoA ligase [Candidatus Omnitrophota bacterium]